MRNGAVSQLAWLITKRSQGQSLLPLPSRKKGNTNQNESRRLVKIVEKRLGLVHHITDRYNPCNPPTLVARVAFFVYACDCGRKQGVAFPSTSHTPTGTRKGEKGGKEVSLSFSENCPLCPRPDNGRLHDRRKVKTHEKKKKRLQDVLAKDLISISELMKYIKNNQPNDTTNRNRVVQDIKGIHMHEKLKKTIIEIRKQIK